MNERGTGRSAIGRVACSRGRVCALTSWLLLLAAAAATAEPADVDVDSAAAPNYEADPAAPKVVASADRFRTPARRPEPGAAPVRGDGGRPG